MVYLDSFYLPGIDGVYPYRVLYPKKLEVINFAPVTVFYGSNGSGKSTLLNVIAEKVSIKHKTLGNSNNYMNGFVEKCSFNLSENSYGRECKIPYGSRFIRSEDIMAKIVQARKASATITSDIRKAPYLGSTLSDDEDDDGSPSFLDAFFDRPEEMTPQARFLMSNSSHLQYTLRDYHAKDEQYSNGETAISYFENTLEPDNLYFLDEPENSMAPGFQIKLAQLIEEYANLLNCQFIIASHSPFILSIENARIYNIDHNPAYTCQWYELENMQRYFLLFQKYKDFFEPLTK
jgi:predicted ATPase